MADAPEYKSLETKIREVRLEKLRKQIAEAAKKQERVTTEVLSEEINEVITNSNSSGQGHDPNHHEHPYHDTIISHGYHYSHTTPIHQKDGSVKYHHTYKHHRNQDYNVAVYNGRWQTSVLPYARKISGSDVASLDKHLKDRKLKPKDNGEPTHLHQSAPPKDFHESEEIEELAPSTAQPQQQDDPIKQKLMQQRQQVQKQKEQIRLQIAQQKAAKQEQAMKQKGEQSMQKVKEDEELVEAVHHIKAKAQTYHDADEKWTQHVKDYKIKAISRKHAIKKALDKIEKDHPGHKEYEAEITHVEESTLDEWGRAPYRIRTFRNANRLLQLHQNRYQNLSRGGDPRSRRLAKLHRDRAMELKRLSYTVKDNPERSPI
jgi:hypothetical protein